MSQSLSIEEKQDFIIYELNEEEKTASVTNNENAYGDILIPRSIQYKDQDYIVTSLVKYCFKNSNKITSIGFSKDSMLQLIERKAFYGSTIESIIIPSSVQELKDGWCHNTPNLTNVTIMPDNMRYIYLDEKMIIGKSDINNLGYDVLVFVPRNIKEIKIPSFIKIIAPYAFSRTLIDKIFIPSQIKIIGKGAFYNCEQLQEVEFAPDSKLEVIGKRAFLKTIINNISIPSSVLELQNDWCSNITVNIKPIETNNKEDNSNGKDSQTNNESIVIGNKIKINSDKILYDIQCPICYLAMLPPLRTPMIIPQCGHTFCNVCISQIKSCPLCHQSITKPVNNILALQFIDSINANKLIPEEINPSPPAENKLIPKIEPICTFAASGNSYIIQKFYQCKTCNMGEKKGFCEICLHKCHKGHDVILSDYDSSFCDCSIVGQCCCMAELADIRCTYELTYGTLVEQPMYQCESCHILKHFYICQNCAIKCHHGHKLRYVGIVNDKICHCFDQCICQISTRKPLCTYHKTGPNFLYQPFYKCHTCGLENGNGCCSACAHYCHKGHNLEFGFYSDTFFCDCGDGMNNCHCQILENSNQSYLTCCPNMKYENRSKLIEQRKYHCLTCGIFDSLGICEACAINCHINHLIKYVGIEKFNCICQTTFKCQMMMVPDLHNDRKECDRKVLEKDDVSACYTCYSCDESGQTQICATCALKNHSDHDIHLISYTTFECNE